jgi:hypothetical protein
VKLSRTTRRAKLEWARPYEDVDNMAGGGGVNRASVAGAIYESVLVEMKRHGTEEVQMSKEMMVPKVFGRVVSTRS